MLAQNFKAAAELDIPEDEMRALIRVLNCLETGLIGPESFDMSNPMQCGTVGCIGGWAAKFMDINGGEYLDAYSRWGRLRNHPLRNLYWPGDVCCDAYHATTSQAADALRRFLVTGSVEWVDVMRE